MVLLYHSFSECHVQVLARAAKIKKITFVNGFNGTTLL